MQNQKQETRNRKQETLNPEPLKLDAWFKLDYCLQDQWMDYGAPSCSAA